MASVIATTRISCSAVASLYGFCGIIRPVPVANHLDFLELLDRHTRESPVGEVPDGSEMRTLAVEGGLAEAGDNNPAARWTGELVDLGYVKPHTSFVPRMVPDGVLWGDRELNSFGRYRVLPPGREEAERIRRHRREQATDVALGRELPVFRHAWLADAQRQALARPLHDLRAALDDNRAPAAVGAAKELVEAACKVVLAHLGKQPPAGASLPTLFKDARNAAGVSDGDLGRSLSATVERLAALRNVVGSGHGRANEPEVSVGEARLAAGAAGSLADFLLGSVA